MLHPDMFAVWIDKFGNDYNVLKFILTAANEKQIWAVLELLPVGKHQTTLITSAPGVDFAIYSKLIGSVPTPELKKYSITVQEKYVNHPCWVQWAGVFDRVLTKEQRTILIHYRIAFTCLLVNGFEDYAETVIKMGESPQASAEITGEFLYSPAVLKYILDLN